jgi:acyl carrier protein
MSEPSQITTASKATDAEASIRAIFETVFSRSFPVAAISRVDLAEWDSLRHVELILVVEEEFGVRFDESEFAGLASLATIVQAVESRQRG